MAENSIGEDSEARQQSDAWRLLDAPLMLNRAAMSQSEWLPAAKCRCDEACVAVPRNAESNNPNRAACRMPAMQGQ